MRMGIVNEKGIYYVMKLQFKKRILVTLIHFYIFQVLFYHKTSIPLMRTKSEETNRDVNNFSFYGYFR